MKKHPSKIKKTYLTIILAVLLFSCNEKKKISSTNPENWSKITVTVNTKDSLEYGKSYLSIYSKIYSDTEHKTHNLTSLISMRNTSDLDTIYLLKAEY